MIRLLYRITAFAMAFCLSSCDLALPDLSPGTDALLTWNVPEIDSDGAPLRDLAGFNIYHAREADLCKADGVLPAATLGLVSSFRIVDLNPGRHFFSVTAFDQSGNESLCSIELFKDI